MAVWALMAQLVMVSIAYPAACMAAAAFATFAVMQATGADFGAGWPALFEASARSLTIAITAAIDALWPSLIAIALTEGLKVRTFVAYLVIGALVGAGATVPFSALTGQGSLPAFDAEALQLSAAAGAIAGFVYWAIAGRSAGVWLGEPWRDQR